ncbi:Endonuclease/exonuclease/phosphatase [Dichomitus squalens]|uniref:Endonuclease/exonuclease/phosphatase n=1 Tax=Dichomitus squalens TaxID=114155 RepID=A0A4Q9Q344_9APHY|nr:Endonuclease/exonuclease/phosphatase [Dichomitus squalens]TBU61662.1 Endonuclease/exonuclease/phosphatase [Dichomitus squalens]
MRRTQMHLSICSLSTLRGDLVHTPDTFAPAPSIIVAGSRADQGPGQREKTTPYKSNNANLSLAGSSTRLSDASSHARSPGAFPSRSYSFCSDPGENTDPTKTSGVQHGILRNLPIHAWSHEASRWTTWYHTPSKATSHIDIVTWNVDFKGQVAAAGRMSCILDHLRDVVLANEPQSAVILLQELNQFSFASVLEHSWVRKHFAITPPDTKSWPWPPRYGIATLVSRQLHVNNAQMLQFHKTLMGRTAVFVDVSLQPDDDPNVSQHVVRIANTHLESLSDEGRFRPVQLRATADILRAPGVHAGVVGGDMNMVGPADQDIHVAAGLGDAGTDGPDSLTWGFQPRSGRWAPKRMDRVFYTPSPGFVVEPVKVIGKGLTTADGRWASDHYGLSTRISLRQTETWQ